MQGSDFCFWHSPEHVAEAQEARRLGGQRRKKESIVSGAYAFEGLESIAMIRRLLEVAVVDALGLENTVSRARTLAYLAQAAARLLEVGELEERIEALERTIAPRARRMAAKR